MFNSTNRVSEMVVFVIRNDRVYKSTVIIKTGQI
jgi:hypothetical protein